MSGLTISIYSDGFRLTEALRKISGTHVAVSDYDRYRFDRFNILGDLTVETQNHISGDSSIRSLFPRTGKFPDLIIVFSQAVGINKALKVGDMVIVAPPEGPSLASRLSNPEMRRVIQESFSPLKAEPFDYNIVCAQVLDYLSETEPKSPRDIAKALNIPEKHCADFFKNVMRAHASDESQTRAHALGIPHIVVPPEKAYWQRDAAFNFYLTPVGIEAKRALSQQGPATESKPSLVIGTSYCSPYVIRSKLPEDTSADVIDQISELTFRAIQGQPYASQTLHVCVVKCLEGEDVEERSPYGDSMDETMVKLVLAVAKRWVITRLSEASSSAAVAAAVV